MIPPVRPQRRKCWKPKVCYASMSEAIAAAVRLEQHDRRRRISRGPVCVYYCVRHSSLHIGHDPCTTTPLPTSPGK